MTDIIVALAFIPFFALALLYALHCIRPRETQRDREISAHCLKVKHEAERYDKAVAEEKAFEETLTLAEKKLMFEIEMKERAEHKMPFIFNSREAYIHWKLFRFRDNTEWKKVKK